MNTANLQLEGLMLALAAMNRALVRKGLLDSTEVEAALSEADNAVSRGPSQSLSAANLDAVSFPIRFLRMANKTGDEGQSFSDLARAVGEANQPSW